MSLNLFFASSMSVSLKKIVFGYSGIPGKTRNPTKAIGIVIMPSMMKSHLQPLRPLTPLRFVYAAAWR